MSTPRRPSRSCELCSREPCWRRPAAQGQPDPTPPRPRPAPRTGLAGGWRLWRCGCSDWPGLQRGSRGRGSWCGGCSQPRDPTLFPLQENRKQGSGESSIRSTKEPAVRPCCAAGGRILKVVYNLCNRRRWPKAGNKIMSPIWFQLCNVVNRRMNRKTEEKC